MNEIALAETMTALYLGGDDPEIISYLDLFINGLHRLKGMFTSLRNQTKLDILSLLCHKTCLGSMAD
jgi:hypothetical protein